MHKPDRTHYSRNILTAVILEAKQTHQAASH